MKAAKNSQGIESYFVMCEYHAKNSFGAYTKQSIRLVMNVKTNKLTRLKY